MQFFRQENFDTGAMNKASEILRDSFPKPLIHTTLNNIIKVAREIFLNPYEKSETLSQKLDIDVKELIVIYRLEQNSRLLQKIFDEESPRANYIQLLKWLLRNKAHTQKIIDGEIVYPQRLELHLGERCQASCVFCYGQGRTYADLAKSLKTLSPEEVSRLINECADHKTEHVNITGGLEPLLSESFIRATETASRRNMDIYIYTNCLALNQKDIIEAVLKAKQLRVSMSGATPEMYSKMMRLPKKIFAQVKENIKQLIKLRDSKKSPLKVGISMVVNKDNYRELFDFVELAKELSLDFVDLRYVYADLMEDFKPDQKKELMSMLDHLNLKIKDKDYHGLQVNSGDRFQTIRGVTSEIGTLLFPQKEYFQRGIYPLLTTIDPFGRVFGLTIAANPAMPGGEEHLLGRVSEQTGLIDVLKAANQKKFNFDNSTLLTPFAVSTLQGLKKIQEDISFGVNIEDQPLSLMQA